MISQITSSSNIPLGNTRPSSAQVVDINSQRLAASVASLNRSTTADNADAAKKADTKNQQDKTIDLNAAKDAAHQVNKVLKQIDRNLQFTVDDDTGTSIVKVIDTQSKEVIRQIPTQEVLEMSKALDKLQGLLFKEKA